jgi:hypothetical protein
MFKNLNAEEARHGMNNKTMSDLLGIDAVTYARKKATGNFKLSEAKKLLAFFGVSFDYLFKKEGEE